MELLSEVNWYYVLIGYLILCATLWWKSRMTKEGKRFISQDIRWCKDVLKISENSLNWLSRMDRPLTQAERDSLVTLGREYYRMSIITGIVIRRNGDNHYEDTKETNIDYSKEVTQETNKDSGYPI